MTKRAREIIAVGVARLQRGAQRVGNALITPLKKVSSTMVDKNVSLGEQMF